MQQAWFCFLKWSSTAGTPTPSLIKLWNSRTLSPASAALTNTSLAPVTESRGNISDRDAVGVDWFDTDEGDTGLDSTVLVFEDNITDCGVIDDQEMIEELD